MMLTSNYDNRLRGVGDGAKAGAVNGNVIICKHDSTLKQPNMFKKTGFELQKFFRLEGQTHLLTCSVSTECLFSEF